MIPFKNKGYEPQEIQQFRERMEALGQNFLIVDSEDNSDEFVNFNFIGIFEGKEVIYDAVLYTLRLQHNSEIYELAEHKAAQRFPEFKKIIYEEDENGDLELLDDLEEEIGLFMAEVMMDLEEEGTVKVREHVELDSNLDYGVGLDAGLNVEKITSEIISDFVRSYNDDTLKLDQNLYSFQSEEEEYDQ